MRIRRRGFALFLCGLRLFLKQAIRCRQYILVLISQVISVIVKSLFAFNGTCYTE